MLSRRFVALRVLVLCAATISLLASASSVQAQVSAEERACRAAISKGFGKYTKALQKAVVGCHKLRDKGTASPASDCNDPFTADQLGKNKPSAALASASIAIQAACAPGGIPIANVLAQFARCPAPFEAIDDGGSTVGIDDFSELIDCQREHTDGLVEKAARKVMGQPALPLEPELQKCHAAIGKSYSKLIDTIVKVRAKCQASLDKAGGPIGFECALADPKQKIQSTRAKATEGIAKGCADADALNLFAIGARSARGVPDLDSCAVDLADVKICALEETAEIAGSGMASLFWELPGICPEGGSYLVVPVTTSAEVDTGFTGMVHDMDPILGYRGAQFAISCDADCANCTTTAITSPIGACRCSSDPTALCSTPGAACLGSGTCECFYGPPTPYVGAGSPACVLSKVEGSMAGGLDPTTGEVTLDVPLRHKIYLGISQQSPCPQCNGGFCAGGARSGLACNVDATDATFGAVSYDCPPSVGVNITGSGLLTDVSFTTGSVSLPFNTPCDPPLSGSMCPCAVCSGNTQVACNSDAECAAVAAGTCTSKGPSGASRRPNDCSDLTCSPDVETDEGTCLAGPVDKYCDGFLRSNGEGMSLCIDNNDCAALGAGACTLTKRRECFLSPIEAEGEAGEMIVGAGCIGATSNAGVNAAIGWPGAYRVRQNLDPDVFCPDGVTEFVAPGGSNCPTSNEVLPPLAGLAQWNKADVGVTVDGSNNVLSWADQSGNGRNWGVGSGSVQWVSNAQNGLPVVRAAGTSNYLTTAAYFTGAQEAEVFVVIKSNKPDTDVNYAWGGFGNDGGVINHYPWYASTIYETFGHASRQGGIAVANNGDATRAYGIYNVSAGTGASNYVLRLNGTELGAVSGSPAWHASTFYLFSYWFNQNFQWLGDIGELLVYDHVLSSTDRNAVYAYLKQRWNTPDGL
jgi:hypothetical protein